MYLNLIDEIERIELGGVGYSFVLHGIFGGKSLHLPHEDGASVSFATGSAPVSHIHFINLGGHFISPADRLCNGAILVTYGHQIYQLQVNSTANCQVTLQVAPKSIRVTSVKCGSWDCGYSWQVLSKARRCSW